MARGGQSVAYKVHHPAWESKRVRLLPAVLAMLLAGCLHATPAPADAPPPASPQLHDEPFAFDVRMFPPRGCGVISCFAGNPPFLLYQVNDTEQLHAIHLT